MRATWKPQAVRRAVEKANAGVQEFPKPTIAMIRGYCIGGGLGLAVCCDLRICADNSRFAVPAAKLGLGYSYAGLRRLASTWSGPPLTREIFFTARQFETEEAVEMGLVNRMVPNAKVKTYVKSYAETIAANAPLTVKAVKYIVGEVDEGRKQAQPQSAARRWWRNASPAAIIVEGRRRSWRSASRRSRDLVGCARPWCRWRPAAEPV